MNVPLGRLYLVAEVMQIGAPASPQTIFYFKFCIFALNRDLEIDVSFLPASPSQIIKAARGEHQIAFSGQMLKYLWHTNRKMHKSTKIPTCPPEDQICTPLEIHPRNAFYNFCVSSSSCYDAESSWNRQLYQ